jgi:hypothetical protein
MVDGDGHNRRAGRDDIDPIDRDDALFVNLILIFQGAAMQQMGKIANPLTGKIERNLEQACFSIDTLAMLREKTRGNLPGDLERLVDSTLVNLRMNFVEESAKAPTGPSKSEGGAAESQGPEMPAEPHPGPDTGPARKAGGDSGAGPDAGGPEASERAASLGKSGGEPGRKESGPRNARSRRGKP